MSRGILFGPIMATEIEEFVSTGENTPGETTSDDASLEEDDRPETS
jgi:hypothetical protein